MASKDKKAASVDPGAPEKPKQTRTRKPKGITLNASDYAAFSDYNDTLIKNEKAKGEGSDDAVLIELFDRKKRLAAIIGANAPQPLTREASPEAT